MPTPEKSDADLDPPTVRIDPKRPPPDVLPITTPIVDTGSDAVAFAEFQLYYESAERVTQRRLDLTRYNQVALVALLLLIGVVFSWAVRRPDHALVGTAGVVILCLMGFIHCGFWTRQIDDLKELHTEKFRILNEMAPYVCFPDTDQGRELHSYEPFRREWAMLLNHQAIREIHPAGRGRVLVLRSSIAESRMAQVFRWLFLLVAAGTVALLVTRGVTVGDISPFARR